MPSDEKMKRRLIYAKYLFLHGQEHARDGTEVSRMIAIHNFDNAVEWILKCVASERGLKPKKGKFFFYDELLDGMRDLLLIVEMGALHDLRNSVQHYGNIPSGEGTIRYMKEAEDFLKNVVKEVFYIEFSELSLASLIEDESIKSLMAEAEKKLEENKYEASIKLSSEAFYLGGIKEQKRIRELFEEHWNLGFNNFGSTIQIGIDFRDFAKFRSITPILRLPPSSDDVLIMTSCKDEIDKWKIESFKQTKENAQYCFTFALKYILKWQSF